MLEQTSTQTAVVIVLPAATFRHSTFYRHGAAFVFLVRSSFFFFFRFDPRPMHVGFLLDKVALGQVFLPVHGFSPVIVVPSVLRGHLYVITLIGRTSGRRLGTLGEKGLFSGRILLIYFTSGFSRIIA